MSNPISESISINKIKGKSYVTVSSKGLSNGLSNSINDGADFGPDTLLGATSPNQYGPPYSTTNGIQEAINYVLSLPTGGRIHLNAGDYYFPSYIGPTNIGYAVIGATIPYNASLILEGEYDATRIHLPINYSSQQAWLFTWGWNGTAPYTRKSILRNMAFINDVNTGPQAMNVLVAGANPNSSGLEIDSVSVYDIKGTALNFTFWINGMYDVTVSKYRFFSINSNAPNTAMLFDSVTLGKIVDSFFFTMNGGQAITNGTGSIIADSIEIYGGWSTAFNLGSTDSLSTIEVTNSILGVPRVGNQGIQGTNNTGYGPVYVVYNSGGSCHFSLTNSQMIAINIYSNSSSFSKIIASNNMVLGNGVSITQNNSSGSIYADIHDNYFLATNHGGAYTNFANNGYTNNINLYFRNNIIYNTNNSNGPLFTYYQYATLENNIIYLTNSNPCCLTYPYSSTANPSGMFNFSKNIINYSFTPSSPTTFYFTYQFNNSGTYYLYPTKLKGNVFNLPASNSTFQLLGTAGSSIANVSILFVDLDNEFNNVSVTLPYPPISTPAVPTSGTSQSNIYQYPVEVYISGGSATAVQVTRGGSTYTVWSSSTATAIPPLLVRLEPNDSITITYSTVPTWTWVPAKA